MVTFAKALELARTWVRLATDDEGVILEEKTIKKPYGWVFFYQRRTYLASGRIEDAYAGNAPILVERNSLEVRIFGTARPVEHYLAEYEASLPSARLQMRLPAEP